MSKQGVISLGDAFIDYISQDPSNTKYYRFLGGATVNTAVWTSRLGTPSYYLTKLGLEEDSTFVAKELKKEKVNIDYSVMASEKKICSVTVHLNKDERVFHSYDNPTPDILLTADELEQELFKKAKLFYFGSGTLFHETAKNTTNKALEYAREHDCLIAFDTNIRLKRWESEAICRQTVLSFLKHADIVKMAEEELFFLTGTNDLEEGLKKISESSIPTLFITMGGEGACAVHDGTEIVVPGVKVEAVDTTGAGDAFMAAILSRFHEVGTPKDHSQLEEYVQFANEVGSRATLKLGSL